MASPPGPAMRSLQRRMVAGMQRLGITVGRYPHPATLEYHLRQVITGLAVGTVVDVGAHHGEFATMLRRRVRYDGRIVSIEPASAAYAVLKRATSGDHLWSSHRYALGTDEGMRDLRLFANTRFNSFQEPTEFGRDCFSMAAVGAEQVQVRRLEGVLDELPRDRAGTLFVKVDSQGDDLDVLRGAGGAVGRITALQLELPVARLYEDAPTLQVALSEVADLGFHLTGIFPVVRASDELRIVEVDCVFCRMPASPASGSPHTHPARS